MLKVRRLNKTAHESGQALTEFALIAPMFFMLLFGIIVIGMAIFYQQQVTNAAREGARFASVHSATARCPTVSNLDPDDALLPLPNSYTPTCDPPSTRWPKMTAHARRHLFGLNGAAMQLTACWSGYWVKDSNLAYVEHDQMATNLAGDPNDFRDCTVRVYGWTPGQDPDAVASSLQIINPKTRLNTAGEYIAVDCGRQFPLTTDTDDMASSYSASNGVNSNQVTVLTCYAWNPPLAGFLLIPKTHHIVGVITEAMQYQQ